MFVADWVRGADSIPDSAAVYVAGEGIREETLDFQTAGRVFRKLLVARFENVTWKGGGVLPTEEGLGR